MLLFLAWTAELPLAVDPTLYGGFWRSPFAALNPLFLPLPGIQLSAWQVLILALAPACLLGAARRRAWPLDVAILVSVASLAVTFAWGLMRGGSAYQAYFQLWRFLLALLVAQMLFAAMTSSRHLKALGLTVLIAALVRGTLAIYFFWGVVRGQIEPTPAYMTSHDDSLLFVAGILVAMSWALARRTAAAWLAAMLVSPYLLYAIVLNNRRLAWIELMLAAALVYIILPWGTTKRRVTQLLIVAAPVVLLYVVVGWNRPGALFAPVAALSTASSYENASALAREEEIRNLLHTLATSNKLMGTGWGMPYEKVTSVYANFGDAWLQYLYLPHNSLLGMAAFGGFAGIFGIWLVIPATAFLAMRGYRGSTRAVHSAGAMTALCILPAYGVQCYGDIGVQSLTCSLILGVALATAGRVSTWEAVRPAAGKGRSRNALRRAEPVPAATELAAPSNGVRPSWPPRVSEGRG